MKSDIFTNVVSGPVSVPYAVGWSLIALGTLGSLAYQQLRGASGQSPDFGRVMARAVIASAALGLYTYCCKFTWAAGQNIAVSVYPDTQMQALGKVMAAASQRYADYSFSVLSLGSAVKDGAVVIMSIVAWVMALLGHMSLETLQVVVWNIFFAYGPMLIGLGCFGLPTPRLWAMGLVQVSSWSITQAVIYRTIEAQMLGYLREAEQLPLLSTRFLEVMDLLLLLGMLPLLIPTVTGWLLGSAVGSGLTAVSPGVMGAVGGYLGAHMGSSAHAGAGGGHAPPSKPAVATNSNSRRPGDH